MRTTFLQVTLSLSLLASSVLAAVCPGFKITVSADRGSSSGILHTATDGSQYPANSVSMSASMYDLNSSGNMTLNGTQCTFLPYLVCRPGLTVAGAALFSTDNNNNVLYDGSNDFLICPYSSLNYQGASSLPATTTLTYSTRASSGSSAVPTQTSMDIPLGFVFLADKTAFVGDVSACQHARLIASDCSDNGTTTFETSNMGSRNFAAQKTAVVEGLAGAAALLGAFLL